MNREDIVKELTPLRWFRVRRYRVEYVTSVFEIAAANEQEALGQALYADDTDWDCADSNESDDSPMIEEVLEVCDPGTRRGELR